MSQSSVWSSISWNQRYLAKIMNPQLIQNPPSTSKDPWEWKVSFTRKHHKAFNGQITHSLIRSGSTGHFIKDPTSFLHVVWMSFGLMKLTNTAEFQNLSWLASTGHCYRLSLLLKWQETKTCWEASWKYSFHRKRTYQQMITAEKCI